MLSSVGAASPGAGARALEEQMAGLTSLLLGSPPISHEYYDPAEFMEGGPQEADRMDELEYEVSQLQEPAPGRLSAAQLRPGSPCPQRPRCTAAYSGSRAKEGQIGLSRGGAWARSLSQSVSVSLCPTHVCDLCVPCVSRVSRAFPGRGDRGTRAPLGMVREPL